MEPREYEIMYRVEEHHWWYRGMEVITRALLERRIRPSARLKILDAGCGTGGAMTTYLAEYGDVTGVDVSLQALNFCRRRKASRLARASVLHLPFAQNSFELVTSFDVLYEQAVMSDLSALREFARVLAAGGWLLMRLPAYDWLRGRHDEQVHTRQRYTMKQVKDRLKQAGLTVEHLSYANTLLFPLAAVKRLGERVLPRKENNSDLSLNAGSLAPLFRVLLSSEARLVAGRGLPFGLSVFAVARKLT
jgi:SAM-dependent methyltransferase